MTRPRARDLGWVASSLLPAGRLNAITDVAGVLVGHTTLIQGDPGPLQVGRGPIRTGVTAIRPHGGNMYVERVAAAIHVLNGFGKSTGLDQVREVGYIETPILLTNTLNVWRVADILLDWMLVQNPGIGINTRGTVNPVVGECHDGLLNDIQGRHVGREAVLSALESANPGPVSEGNVGGGTGTQAYEFKAGIGTASRVLPAEAGGFTVGVLVQANFGLRRQLIIRGLPVGEWLSNWPENDLPSRPSEPESGSCMMIVATDAPLDARQLGRLARRAPLGLARTGAVCGPGSGDYVIAFSTTSICYADEPAPVRAITQLSDEWHTFEHLAQAVVEATDEAVLNSLAAADTMAGRDGNIAFAAPIERIQTWLNQRIT
jgi:D-aminopeptidase